MALKQTERMLNLKSPVDGLVLARFQGREQISGLFQFDMEMISDNNAIEARQIVGKSVTVGVRKSDGSYRPFNGFISRFYAGDEFAGEGGDTRRNYRAEMVPWLWFLTLTTDCRIFQNKTVPEIIEQVFQDLGLSDYEISQIRGNHPKREYCVQYRESDFAFVSRLMEEEGVFYYFRHEESKHTLVMADHKDAHQNCDEREVNYPRDTRSKAIEDHIRSWEHQYEFCSGKAAYTDYNFIDHPPRSERTPASLLMTNTQSVVPYDGVQKYELYDYPGEYAQKGDGEDLVKLRMEEAEVVHDLVVAESTCRSFYAGGKFKIKQHRSGTERDKSYVITSIEHTVTESLAYETGWDVEEDYHNRFRCIPESVTFRPARSTPRPMIRGSQTAMVVGPDGEEIWPDRHARVKVQFHWDREGQRDDKTSCWIRCMQASAGKGWGSMFIPRIGQEVVVSYLEGDPDQPLITGLVYNADQTLPYALPDEKTKSYIKTNSSPDGDGYNELRFEDKKDQEQIFLHAQRNMDTRVLADSMENVCANRHLIVGTDGEGGKTGDQHEMVYRDKHLKVHRNQEEHIGGDMKLKIGGIDGLGNQHIVIQKDKAEKIDGNSDLKIGGNRSEAINGKQSLAILGDQHEKVGGVHALEAMREIHLKAGMTVVIEAGLDLTIKGAGGFVKIDAMGVTIQGNLVNINSGGAPGVGGGSSPTSPQTAQDASPVEPIPADDSTTGQKSTPF